MILLSTFCGYIYAEHLTRPGMILNYAYLWAERSLPGFLFKPLIGCFRCVCGQWAGWTYLAYVFCGASDFYLPWLIASMLVGTGVSIILHGIYSFLDYGRT